jgi:hypothetical protein
MPLASFPFTAASQERLKALKAIKQGKDLQVTFENGVIITFEGFYSFHTDAIADSIEFVDESGQVQALLSTAITTLDFVDGSAVYNGFSMDASSDVSSGFSYGYLALGFVGVAAVGGIDYFINGSSTAAGKTGVDGSFEYLPTDTITLKVGGLLLVLSKVLMSMQMGLYCRKI